MEDLEGKTVGEALLFYRTYRILETYRILFCRTNMPQNLSNDEFIALQSLSKNKDLMVTVLIINRQDCINNMDNILSNHKKFTIVNSKDDTLLNFPFNQEKHVDRF